MTDEINSLDSLAPTVDELLESLRKSTTFVAINTLPNSLTQDDKSMLLDKHQVAWETLRKGLLASITGNEVSKKSQGASRTKKHTKRKQELWKSLSRSYPTTIESEDAESTKKTQWRSAVYLLACEFTEKLEFGLSRQIPNLDESINTILESYTYTPSSDVLVLQTLYHLASWLVSAAEKVAKKKKGEGELAQALFAFVSSARLSKDEAKQASLPTGKTESEERWGGLSYASNDFYLLVVKIDSVYKELLSKKKIAVLGTFILNKIRDCVAVCELGFEKFLPQGTEKSIIMEVQKILIQAYGNMRGKDYAKATNARAKANHTVAHRAKMAVVSDPEVMKSKAQVNAPAPAPEAAAPVPPASEDEFGGISDDALMEALNELESSI